MAAWAGLSSISWGTWLGSFFVQVIWFGKDYRRLREWPRSSKSNLRSKGLRPVHPNPSLKTAIIGTTLVTGKTASMDCFGLTLNFLWKMLWRVKEGTRSAVPLSTEGGRLARNVTLGLHTISPGLWRESVISWKEIQFTGFTIFTMKTGWRLLM